MKKVLFIDDELKRIEDLHKILLENIQKNVYVDFAFSVYDYFEVVDSGKSVKEVKDMEQYAFVFIHKSINDERIPESIFSAIENKIGKNKLFTFSGGSENLIRERKFKRERLYNMFTTFVNFKISFGNWYIPVLYYSDYKQRYEKQLVEKIRKLDSISSLPESVEYIKLAKLLGFSKEAYKRFDTLKQFIDAIINKIENG